jgi:hypothetical protein
MSGSRSSTEHGPAALPGHLQGFALMHVAMRRDAARLRAAATAWRPSGAPWWQMFRDVVVWHHRSEDDVLWPTLRRTDPVFAAQAGPLADDHRELDTAMEAVSAAAGHGGAGLPAAAGRFEKVLLAHLRDEEAVVLPAFERMGKRAYLAEERRLIRTAPPRVLAVLQPWMFDGAPAESVAHVSATVPPPLRLAGATVLRARYRRIVKGLQG